MAGGRDHFGWGEAEHILANVYDAVNTNTRATGNWKKSPPQIDPHPRPVAKRKPRDRRRKKSGVTVADLYRMAPKGGGVVSG